MKFNAIFAAGLLATTAAAHPHHTSHAQVKRQAALSKRCASAAGAFNQKRHTKRMAKRALEQAEQLQTREDGTPHYATIQNDTCVLTPEVTQGPYVWPRAQTLRQDMSEDQAGVPLWLDVGVLDMATCEPLPNVLVSFWHCNATGSYSSFTALSPNTPFGQLLDQMNLTETFEIGETDLHTDDTTFLRGMWPTNDEGMMEMKTIFPGFYVERAIHIHTQIHTNWTLAQNGTVAASNKVSTGQLYFDEALSEQIMALQPYASHSQIERTTNDVDNLISSSMANGFNPIVSIIPADGENVANGVIGYVTMGVDTTAIETGDAGLPFPTK